MMKRRIVFIGMVAMSTMLWAADTMLYSLQHVTSVSKNNHYVLVQNGRAIRHVESDNGLATREIDLSQPIDTMDDCVWRLKSAGVSGKYFLYFKDKGITYYLRNSKNNQSYSKDQSINLFIVGDESTTIWLFTFTDNVAEIENAMLGGDAKNGNYLTINNSNLCIARTTGSSEIHVYQLVPGQYTRTEIASDQIGTICLPFATESYSGATFYTLACKEMDAQSQPSKIYYELVTGQLEAGKPYVYVPDGEATTLNFTAAEGTNVTAPSNYNGFMGTFTQIDPAEQNALTANYVIQGNQFKKCGSNCGLRAYRAYVKINEVPDINEVSAPSRRMLVIGQTTAPEYMEPNQGIWTSLAGKAAKKHVQRVLYNGKVLIVRGGINYDVLGRKCYE